MTPFDKCPVCGGEIVEKKVEKILRGGNLTEIVKARAEVCLRCGEHLYAPDVVKRFKKIRLKLQKEQMAGRQSTARSRLLDKLDYEVWLLDFLEKRYDMAKGKEDIPVLVIRSGEQPDRLERVSEEWVGSGAPILDAMMPFTFIASFKTLDMIFEWILAENSIKIPRQFTEKKKLLKNKSSFQLPPLFKNQPYLYDYAKALFCQLLPYRNEVIHNNSFCVSGDILNLSSSKQGTSLTLSSRQVDYLVRFVRALVRALASEIAIDAYTDKILRHYLDILAPVHGLATFNQQVPRFVHIVFKVPKCGAAFPADLKQVRDKVARKFPTQEVIFDLTVLAMEGECLIAKWYFAPEEVPDTDVMTFYEESHKAHRVSLDESQIIKA